MIVFNRDLMNGNKYTDKLIELFRAIWCQCLLKDAAAVYSLYIYIFIDTQCLSITVLGPLRFIFILQMIKLRHREQREAQKRHGRKSRARLEIHGVPSTLMTFCSFQ